MEDCQAKRLLDAALAGDAEALPQLVRALTPVIQHRVGLVLLRIARPMTDPAQEAMDLTQEVLLQLFRDQGRLLRTWDPERGASLLGFVGLVAQRRAISLVRGRGCELVLSDSLEETSFERHPALRAGGHAPELETAAREQLRQVLARLQGLLSPLGLEMFYRLFVHEESAEQIAASIGLTTNAVYIWRTRLTRLCQRLAGEAALATATPPARPAGGGIERGEEVS